VESELTGYRGGVLKLLDKSGARVGDKIRITKGAEDFTGLLMPRIALGDPNHVVMKLMNGYNIGIRVDADTNVLVLERGEGIKEPELSQPTVGGEALPFVSIIGTGGTIASKVDYRTGAVFPSLTSEDLYRTVPELSKIARVKTSALCNILSEDMSPKRWGEIAEAAAVQVREGEAKGIVIAHGTDTMAYTAAALAFALQNLPIPVILVGSQRSPDRPSSDAAVNLMAAVTTAVKAPFAEVAIAMHGWISDDVVSIHRATKVRKCHTSRRDAFRSINATPMGEVRDGKVTMLTTDYKPRGDGGKLKVASKFDNRVALIKTYPGFSPALIDWLVASGYRGIVFEGTGLGHTHQNCLDAVERAGSKGLVLAMTSQCLWGEVRMTVYDKGRDLLSRGVIPLDDMLPETATVKMMWALGKTQKRKDVEELMKANLAGEYSSGRFPEHR